VRKNKKKAKSREKGTTRKKESFVSFIFCKEGRKKFEEKKRVKKEKKGLKSKKEWRLGKVSVKVFFKS
jgi:hypothetical protein